MKGKEKSAALKTYQQLFEWNMRGETKGYKRSNNVQPSNLHNIFDPDICIQMGQ